MMFLNGVIYAAFILIVIVIVFSFTLIKQELKTITKEEMGEAISNSKTTRDFSKLFSDISFLSQTFYGNNDFLKTEGDRLVKIIDNILETTIVPEFATLLLDLNHHFSTLLNDCATINTIIENIKFIDQKTHTMLTRLEDLIAEIIISQTLEGENTDFATQLLTLAIGYRESLLQVKNQFLELGHDHYLNFSGDRSSPVVTKIDDLILRLQTITASTPNVTQHGIKITQNVTHYMELVLRYYEAMDKLSQTMTSLNHAKALLVSTVESVEQKIVKTVQNTEKRIDRIFFSSSSAVVALAVIVILILVFTTRHLMRTAIMKPMNSLLAHIDSFKDARLERRIDLGRKDEWTIIEKGLNDMAAELSRTYTTLEQNEKFLTTIIENIPHMVFVKDADDLRFVRFNKAGEDLLGYSRDALIGKNDYDFFPKAEADFFTTKDREVIDKGLLVNIPEESIQTRDKTLRTLHTKKIPIMDEHGRAKYLLGISEDITQKKELEENLRQTYKMESIGTLAGGIAHDFNNILYMITGNAELALEDIPISNPAHDSLKEIKDASLRAAGIVKQLLTFSRKSEEKMVPIDAVSIIKDALKFLRSTIPSSVEIRPHIIDSKATILGNAVKLTQVLMNLCINASQEMEEIGGAIDICVEKVLLTKNKVNSPLVQSAKGYLRLTITDNGPGIDPEHIERIFDPYFTTKDIGKGSGMGLAVVHGIVESFNGIITVESDPKKETTFILSFPIITDEPLIKAKKLNKISNGTESILFVDDEPSIVNMMTIKLKRLGYQVEGNTNPVEALRIFESNPDRFNLVITDMTMPQMNGAKLSKKIKAIRPNIPILICTGHSPLINKMQAKKLGVSAFIMKPLKKADITIAIRNAMDEVK